MEKKKMNPGEYFEWHVDLVIPTVNIDDKITN